MATKKLVAEVGIEKVNRILKESKLPKKYQDFIFKRLKGNGFSNVNAHYIETASDLIGHSIYHDETPEYAFDEYFWSDLADSIKDFDDSNDPDDLIDLIDLGKVKSFDFLEDYGISISEKEGLAVGCQRMDKPTFIKFIKESGKFMGLEVKEKSKKK